MARLPSGQFLVQRSGDKVMLFEDGTERELVRIDASDADAFARAQLTIYESELSDEDKCFAHFWFGYFYAHAAIGEEFS